MKLISILGRNTYLLIAFSILVVHNEYWNMPLLLSIFFHLSNSTLAYPYLIFPIIALSILLYSLTKYGKQTIFIRKYILNIGAYFLLTGSIYLMMYLEGGSNKSIFDGIVPFTTLILFCIVSICFLITNTTGLIKFLMRNPAK